MQLRKLEIPFYDIYYCKSSSCRYRVAPSNVVPNRKPNRGKRIVLNFLSVGEIFKGVGGNGEGLLAKLKNQQHLIQFFYK